MRRPISLTLRLNLFFGISALIVFSGFGWFIERSMEHHFRSGDAEELEIIATAVTQAMHTHPEDTSDALLLQRLNDFLIGHHGVILQVMRADKSIFFKSAGKLDLTQFSIDSSNKVNTSTQRWNDGEHTYRILTYYQIKSSNSNESYTMSVAMPIDYHLIFLANFRYALWSMIASGIFIMSIMGWLAIRQGHVPLHNIISQIRRIHANELNTRLSPDSVPHELEDLAISFNEMLARMEQDFQRLTNFSADIAHELRTPVTSLLTQTQVVLSQIRSNDEYKEILYSNIEEYERMAQMIGNMLFLAQTENGLVELDAVEINLSEEVQSLYEYYEAWADEKGVSLSFTGNATVVGDRLMLRRVIGNLLSNAIKHTSSGNKVSIKLSHEMNNDTSICIENTGADIPMEHIPKLFDRFYRVDASRQRNGDSTGLGLAIAHSIVEIHGGNIEVISSEGITQFTVKIPVLSQAKHN